MRTKLPTFPGGVHPPEGKALTAEKAMQQRTPRGELVYPLSQHIGTP